MKKWIIGAALLVFTSLGAAAQQEKRTPPSPEERAQRMTDRMAEKLGLTETQKKEIFAINLENAQKRQQEMEAQKAERDAQRADMKAQEDRINQVLTEDQRKLWEEIKMENRDRRRPGGQIHDREDLPRGPRRGNK